MNVVEFPAAHIYDFAKNLRNLADHIEAGTYDEVGSIVVVLRSHELRILGIGEAADGTVAHYLLCCAAHKIQVPMVEA